MNIYVVKNTSSEIINSELVFFPRVRPKFGIGNRNQKKAVEFSVDFIKLYNHTKSTRKGASQMKSFSFPNSIAKLKN